ncbi:MAG: IS1595 family transposase [Chloroflexi bacterium]|nr:IS1595 family transposase [Chloroflexota bacterium]
MAHSAPGKHHRKGLSLVKLTQMFPTDEAAREWFESVRWANGPYCPHCGSTNVQAGIKHRSMTHRCRDCPKRRMFSLKTGTAMEGSKLGYRVWAIAIYLLATNLKGVSSMKLHRDLDICQKSAWYLAHRLREGWKNDSRAMFSGPVEVDETFVGGKRKNMSNAKRKELKGRGAVGKVAVAGVKDRKTKDGLNGLIYAIHKS